MAKIKLVGGGEATVDGFNFNRFNKYLWYKCEKCRHIVRVVDGKTVYMCLEVLGAPGGTVCGACNPCPIPKLAKK